MVSLGCRPLGVVKVSFDRVVRRVVPFICVVSVIAPVVDTAPASATTGSVNGVVDGNYTTTFDSAAATWVRSYSTLYFYGELSAGGVTYDGGFYIAGLSDTEGFGGPGSCVGTCIPPPVVQTNWTGQDVGVVHAFDPSPGKVGGQCTIQSEADELTGPDYAVEVARTIVLACSLSLLGGPVQPVPLTVTAASDDVGFIAGTY